MLVVVIIGISWQVLKYFLILSYTCQSSLDSSSTFQTYISRERKALHAVFTDRPATCRTNLYECCRIAQVTDTLFHWWNITLCVVKGYRNNWWIDVYIHHDGRHISILSPIVTLFSWTKRLVKISHLIVDNIFLLSSSSSSVFLELLYCSYRL